MANDVAENKEKNEFEVTSEEYTSLFNSEYGASLDEQNDEPDERNFQFGQESYEFQKFLATPGYKDKWLTRDLELSYLKKDSEVQEYSDLLSFVDEIYKLGAVKSAKWFALQVFSQLALRVSIDGFGRKELNPRRSQQEVIQTEESGGGILGVLKRRKR